MTDSKRPAPWHHQAAAVMRKHFLLKSIGTMLFISLFFIAYFYVLKVPAFPATIMPLTWLDRLIGFQPMALILYVSLWVYVSLPPILLATRRELYAYGAAMSATCAFGLMVFYFWPTAAPAPDIDWTLYPGVTFLKNIDASGNAFPSLHVATAIFSGIWLHHLLRRIGTPSWILIINGFWCVGIIYATLATRQHVAVDMFGGLALGWLAAWLSWRRHARYQAARELGLPI